VQGGTATVTIVVASVNDAPVAADDTDTTAEDTAVTLDVRSNDTDVDEFTSLSVPTIVDSPAHGTAVVNGDGTITYTPAGDSNGPDSFTYTVSDGQTDSNVATVTLTVTAVNDAPTANDDAYNFNVVAGMTVSAPGVLDNDTDPDTGAVLTAHLEVD